MGFFRRLGRKEVPSEPSSATTERPEPPRAVVVSLEVDDEGVGLLRDGCVAQRVRWADLVEVGVMTTDEGPLGEDFWLILIGADDKGCAVPSELPGFVELRDRVFKLPAFDFENWIEACGSTENAKFVCWKRP